MDLETRAKPVMLRMAIQKGSRVARVSAGHETNPRLLHLISRPCMSLIVWYSRESPNGCPFTGLENSLELGFESSHRDPLARLEDAFNLGFLDPRAVRVGELFRAHGISFTRVP